MNLNDLALDVAAVINVISHNVSLALSCAAHTKHQFQEKLSQVCDYVCNEDDTLH